MKKRFCGLLAVVLLTLPLSVSYAEETSRRGRGGNGPFAEITRSFSLGAGGGFTSDFGGGYAVTTGDPSFMGGGSEISSVRTPYMGGGGFVFMDATFVELSLGFLGGSGTDLPYSFTGLDIGLLGKLPIAVNDRFALFPLLGINHRAMLLMRDGHGNEIDNTRDFNSLWFRLGGGMDISFTDNIFLRGQALYGIRRPNRAERNAVDSFYDNPNVNARTLQGHGLEIRLAVGYRF